MDSGKQKTNSFSINQLERLQRIRKGDKVPAPVNIDLSVNTENVDREEKKPD